eukprot:gnl/TRDRNA2_/TRDRNA2_146397_c0_seq2.p1 gnl/TRDRNA2_/TRDRNA2_146397_c0~~gnl/TRDRNA2_/TRDRNA2_146397_c0_seq2.p1  ORF type:complete len:313 (+),score=68.01 gnl/TRDRNA2_/TRDRNA2_146397_c0_seq2:43-981(+)
MPKHVVGLSSGQSWFGRWIRALTLVHYVVSPVDSAKDDVCHLEFPLQFPDSAPSESADIFNWEELVEDMVYKKGDITGYMQLPAEELEDLNKNFSEGGDRACKPATFGELDSVKIFKNPGFHLSDGDYFMDLGSGVGKAVIHASLMFNASLSVGVELSEGRFRESCRALTRLEEILRSASCSELCRQRVRRPGRIEMRKANVLDVDLSNVTAVMMYSNCFPTVVQEPLQRKLLTELPLGARVQTLDTTGWDKRLVIEGRTLELQRGIGMLVYNVETVRNSQEQPRASISSKTASLLELEMQRRKMDKKAEEL